MLACRAWSSERVSVERKPANPCMGAIIRRIVNEAEQSAAGAERSKPAAGWQFSAFREWRAHAQPLAQYQTAPRVWRPERLGQFAGHADREWRMLKGSDPRLTGLAYSDRDVFLVEVVGELTAEH